MTFRRRIRKRAQYSSFGQNPVNLGLKDCWLIPHSHNPPPLDGVLALLHNQPDSLENICNIVDSPDLLHIHHLGRLKCIEWVKRCLDCPVIWSGRWLTSLKFKHPSPAALIMSTKCLVRYCSDFRSLSVDHSTLSDMVVLGMQWDT